MTLVACALGGFANNYFIRQPELIRGIQVSDPASGKQVQDLENS